MAYITTVSFPPDELDNRPTPVAEPDLVPCVDVNGTLTLVEPTEEATVMFTWNAGEWESFSCAVVEA